MTIADFWGIESVAPEIDDGMGISLVITRTEKGQNVFDKIKAELKWKEVSYEDGVRRNPSECTSAIRPTERDTFFDDLSSISFKKMEKKYAKDRKQSFLKKAVQKAKQLVKKVVKKSTQKKKSNADYGMLFTFYQGKKK